MGMTIDEAIIQSRIQLIIWEEGCESKLNNSPKAVETLIEIARKYQKIEQIYREWFSDTGRTSADAYERIGEVLEDGNDTTNTGNH